MYAYLKGRITYRSASYLIVEVGGIGFRVLIPLSTYTALQGIDVATIYTHLHITEEAHTLYGFATEAERNLFGQLLSVRGVGPTSALLLLSAMSVEEIRAAIIGEQAHVLQRAKGIGPKVSKQIILDLKDRLIKEAPEPASFPLPSAALPAREEAIAALVALGYPRPSAQKVLNQLQREQPHLQRIEDLVRAALRLLS
ncbi:MAG: Holliday junction branch migration protein RuvA [Saprospiraceae bacterium]|nr:Holliday junction branch migration protein RuvA [Saprospiraceae bacterium]MDW8484722.1 Holliday junction branch migration protein RuvA [Saprospiraceae bacterium]